MPRTKTSVHPTPPVLADLRRRVVTAGVTTRHLLPLIATAALVPALAPATASAAGTWSCDASAVTGSVLGTTALEPAVAGAAGAACRTVESRAGVPLPAPLGSGTVVAGTSLLGPAKDVAAQTAIAAAGLTELSTGSLRDLGLAVPQVEVPAGVRSLQVDLSAVNALLPEKVTVPQPPQLPQLPPLPEVPLVPGLPGLPGLPEVPEVPEVPLPEVPLPDLEVEVPRLATTTTTLDIGGQVDRLVGAVRTLPDLRLVQLKGAMAYAKASCAGGRPSLTGLTQVAGLTVLGKELPTDRAVSEALTLLDAGLVDLTTIDLAGLSVLPAPLRTQLQAILDLVPGTVDAQVLAAVDKALDDAVAALPKLPIPAALATIDVAPGTQTTDGRTLTQRGPSVKVSVLGQPVLDLAIGRATVGGAVACAAGAAGDVAPDLADGGTEPEALRCTTRKVVLTDVARTGEQVRLRGTADPDLAGEVVKLVFAGRTTVARAVVARDGRFSAVAKAPAKALRTTNAARYQAVVNGERSLDLKLTRRMVVESLARRGGKVVITGKVTGPLASPVAPITVQRRVSCTRYVEAGTIRPDALGRFRAEVDGPPAGQAAVYRLGTKVRRTLTNPKTFPTFTLPRSVEQG